MRIISGIQPSGELHIGNYLGAIKNWLELQKNSKNECWFFIADYHSLSEDYEPKEKSKEILDLATDLLALGLDPKKSVIFQQSDISDHAALAWIFNTIVKVSELERMTQFKDKVMVQKQNVNAALLTYPTLMAADILIYKAEAVPVGEDQVQHLEITRDIAKRFNTRFEKTFPEPKPILTETARVMSLSDPTKKMSKSHGPKSYIALNDSPETIEEKIKSAVSDPGGKGPGGANLLSIFKSFAVTREEKTEYEQFNKDHDAGKLMYSKFKPRLAELIAGYFAEYRKNHENLAKDPDYVKKVLEDGAEKASSIAQKTLKEVKKKIGLTI
ncbi:tryptophan--tRNA ligase [Candidatus Azambacteria bacterium RIFCSPHIGHO2_01_FULL_44_55]|uniref:Tryptophan--tRNA ligase n=1 Tax=Candidatus Azambacteria bacterium RIFCSPLOWO2_02_FULL_44_14 TaxID=1797306 RepID=A0A1F5CCH1_9BACT|nr:MAG: tryptophan--tRNA ligase [Candidatus Azambacteria bacterium RIFCSPLOWO2_01_FULL_44_84]OGD32900.1 MAG: tryptophan--tRNA ligase [Candidatus Azambacteria bacterium RIFCSPHIGHO2_02_FULL_45_18]OGD40555.1 MAG: tryptophan--tRNA ligase [Candidatus Azambacteria bacterium RIFCSPLOWO2_02_FULL_44_14]OGD41556.1 MAG: tryptophan--tRNA ligase [Candidatus Azambacteria bacterium RIFCSPHIGHO2_01_FULL_44_55]